MALAFPPPWRAYLQRDNWFHRGWRATGDYVWLYDTTGTVDIWTFRFEA